MLLGYVCRFAVFVASLQWEFFDASHGQSRRLTQCSAVYRHWSPNTLNDRLLLLESLQVIVHYLAVVHTWMSFPTSAIFSPHTIPPHNTVNEGRLPQTSTSYRDDLQIRLVGKAWEMVLMVH